MSNFFSQNFYYFINVFYFIYIISVHYMEVVIKILNPLWIFQFSTENRSINVFKKSQILSISKLLLKSTFLYLKSYFNTWKGRRQKQTWNADNKVAATSFDDLFESQTKSEEAKVHRKTEATKDVRSAWGSMGNKVRYWVSEWLLFNAKSAIFQLYHGENK